MQLICHIFGETNYFTVEDLKGKEHPYSTRAVGRPRKYDNVEALQKEVDAYFEWCKGEKSEQSYIDEYGLTQYIYEREPEPYTITGLALYLGFVSRQSMHDYIDRGDEFSYVIKAALSRVEHGYERRLSGTAPTGAIFALKNMKWKDKTEQELSGNMGIIWNETKTYDQSAPFPPNILTKSAEGDPEP